MARDCGCGAVGSAVAVDGAADCAVAELEAACGAIGAAVSVDGAVTVDCAVAVACAVEELASGIDDSAFQGSFCCWRSIGTCPPPFTFTKDALFTPGLIFQLPFPVRVNSFLALRHCRIPPIHVA